MDFFLEYLSQIKTRIYWEKVALAAILLFGLSNRSLQFQVIAFLVISLAFPVLLVYHNRSAHEEVAEDSK